MIPPKTDKRWEDILTGAVSFNVNSFAFKMMLTRLRTHVARDSSAAARERCIDELREFFVRHEELVRSELNNLFQN